MASPPPTPRLSQVKCDPAYAATGQPVCVTARVRWVEETPQQISLCVRSPEQRVVRQSRLAPVSRDAHTATYCFQWLPAADLPPGDYQITLRIAGAEHSSNATVTILSPSRVAKSLQALEAAIAAYEEAGESQSAAQAMAAAADLYLKASQPAAARQRLQQLLGLREKAGDLEGAADCRRRIAAIGKDHGAWD